MDVNGVEGSPETTDAQALIWQVEYGLTDKIAVITPATGRVVAWLNLKGLMPGQANPDAVLNGIAYDATRDRLFVTGKLWPRMFEIRIIRR